MTRQIFEKILAERVNQGNQEQMKNRQRVENELNSENNNESLFQRVMNSHLIQ